jgi:glycerol-3-phosphate O-acyltransferase
MDDCSINFFLEGNRSRNFKMQKPNTETLQVITSSVLENKIKDAWILPVTINYEKVLEGQTFPYELMGEDRV